jgi:hypothetical protein
MSQQVLRLTKLSGIPKKLLSEVLRQYDMHVRLVPNVQGSECDVIFTEERMLWNAWRDKDFWGQKLSEKSKTWQCELATLQPEPPPNNVNKKPELPPNNVNSNNNSQSTNNPPFTPLFPKFESAMGKPIANVSNTQRTEDSAIPTTPLSKNQKKKLKRAEAAIASQATLNQVNDNSNKVVPLQQSAVPISTTQQGENNKSFHFVAVEEEEEEEGEIRDDYNLQPLALSTHFSNNTNTPSAPSTPVVMTDPSAIHSFFGFAHPASTAIVSGHNTPNNTNATYLPSVPSFVPSISTSVPTFSTPVNAPVKSESILPSLIANSSTSKGIESTSPSAEIAPTPKPVVSGTTRASSTIASVKKEKSDATSSHATVTPKTSAVITTTNAPISTAKPVESHAILSTVPAKVVSKEVQLVTASSSTTTRTTKYVHPNKSPSESPVSKWPSPSSSIPFSSFQTIPTKSKWSPPPSADIPSISTPAKSISTKSRERDDEKHVYAFKGHIAQWKKELQRLIQRPRYFVSFDDLTSIVPSHENRSEDFRNYKQKLAHINTCIEIHCYCAPLV